MKVNDIQSKSNVITTFIEFKDNTSHSIKYLILYKQKYIPKNKLIKENINKKTNLIKQIFKRQLMT